MSTAQQFFYDGHWGQCLELLTHLLQYSESILLVSGPTGIGKTSMLAALSGVPDLNMDFINLKASNALSAESLAQILDDKLSGPINKDIALLIDDAEHLSLNATAFLLQLKQRSTDQKIHIALFAEPEYEAKLSQSLLKDEFSEFVHVVELEPLTLVEVESFINKILNKNLDKNDYKKIYSASQGIPGKIQDAVNNHINSKSNSKKTRKNLSPIALSITLAFGVFFCAIAVLWPDADELLVNKPKVLPVPNIAIDDTNLNKSVDNAIQNAQLPRESIDEIRVVKDDVSYIQEVVQDENEDNQATEYTVQKEEYENKLAQLQDRLNSIETKLKSEQRIRQKLEKQLKQAAKLDDKPFSFSNDEKYILGVAKDNYTIQLLASHNQAKLQSFIKGHSLGNKVRCFKTTYNNKPWYVLIYGNYTSKSAASIAISQLPNSLKNLKPWPRVYSGIQNSIRKKGTND